MLDFIVGILTTPIRVFVMFFLPALGVFIMCIPELLWKGIRALWRGLCTMLEPSRRAEWLGQRREGRARKRRLREPLGRYEHNAAAVDEENVQLARMRKESEQRLATLLRRHEQARRQRVRHRLQGGQLTSVSDTNGHK
ncbi:hypothetical protein [Streptomyces sp. NPDC085540]|uniref:hypothetical protein n=1 Tax=Streptomyces sp. NPDC085540 TaxID=3365730 RepID=UPI0037D98FBA